MKHKVPLVKLIAVKLQHHTEIMSIVSVVRKSMWNGWLAYGRGFFFKGVACIFKYAN